MEVIGTVAKEAYARLPYGLDWSAEGWLPAGETIVDSTWEITHPSEAPELRIEGSTFDATVCTVWLSGGVRGKRYRVTNKITTSPGGLEDRRSFAVLINQEPPSS
jgi:hypothetical protein